MIGYHARNPRGREKKGQRALAACPKNRRSEEGQCPAPDTPQRDQGSLGHKFSRRKSHKWISWRCREISKWSSSSLR